MKFQIKVSWIDRLEGYKEHCLVFEKEKKEEIDIESILNQIQKKFPKFSFLDIFGFKVHSFDRIDDIHASLFRYI